MSEHTKHHRKIYVIALAILLALFCFRVLAQFLQYCFEIPFLPSFGEWQSGAVPYSALLASQILIIVVYGLILRRIATNHEQSHRWQGWVFVVIGLIYFTVMMGRLLIGVTGLSEHYWFYSYLPTLFHFVLSAYLIIAGYFHLQATAR